MNALTIPALFFSIFAPSDAEPVEVQIDTKSYHVEIADTPYEQMKGLMGRSDLGPREGMLFVYEKVRDVQFWMKNVDIPLDMIFLDACGTIVQIHENAKPDDVSVIASTEPVRAVLELRGGASKRDQIRQGDIVKMSMDVFDRCEPT